VRPLRRATKGTERNRSGDDDAGLLALKFRRGGKLAAEKFDEAAGARPPVGTQEAHAEEKDEKLKNFCVFNGAKRRLGRVLFGFGQKSGEGVVKFASEESGGRLFVDDAGSQGLVGFGERAEGGENIGIGGRGLRGAEFGDGKSDGGQKLALCVNGVLGDADVEQGSVGGKRAGMIVFVAVRGDEIGAVRRAVDSDFAFCAATNGADLFSLCGAEASGLAFLANGTDHKNSLETFRKRPPPFLRQGKQKAATTRPGTSLVLAKRKKQFLRG
jgi:hypothetical protein